MDNPLEIAKNIIDGAWGVDEQKAAKIISKEVIRQDAEIRRLEEDRRSFADETQKYRNEWTKQSAALRSAQQIIEESIEDIGAGSIYLMAKDWLAKYRQGEK